MLHSEQVRASRGKQVKGAVVFAHGRLQVSGIGGGEDEGGLRYGLSGGISQSAGDALLCVGGYGEQQACHKSKHTMQLNDGLVFFHDYRLEYVRLSISGNGA